MNFIFPPTCPLCEKAVEKQGEWCGDCILKQLNIHRVSPEELYGEEYQGQLAGGIFVITEYRGIAGELIRGLKYQRKFDEAKALEFLVSEALKNEVLLDRLHTIDFTTPIPLSPDRYKKRGFNQVEKIFSRPLELLGLDSKSLLERRKNTVAQHELNAEGRKENLAGAFFLKRKYAELVRGKNILLLDDILTTGTTALYNADVLMKAGADSVSVLVLASDHVAFC